VRAILAGYQAVGLIHGGPLTQIRRSAEHLGAFGIEAKLFDPWVRLDRSSADLFHLFSAGVGTYHLAREIHGIRMPLVVSPIMFSRHSGAFVRKGLAMSRVLQHLGPGLWSDYAFAADTCSWADMVVPNTRAEADLVMEGLRVPPERIRVVPNGVDAAFGSGDPSLFEKQFGLRGFILNVGHVGPARKNVLGLIKACAGIDHPTVIIGRILEGAYADECRKEAARYKQIHLIGALAHDSALLASAYAACDVFVLPSQFETPGIAALEAGLAGAKVVITEHGGTREYFGDLATYVDDRSPDSIREGILASLSLPKKPRLQEHIRDHYLWQNVAGRLAAVYREVVTEPAQ
jgi:glycosyltransferase involved in cell wall biosynthesis